MFDSSSIFIASTHFDTAEWAFGFASWRTVRTLSLEKSIVANRIYSKLLMFNVTHILNAVKVLWRMVWTSSTPICVRRRSKLINKTEITAVSQSRGETQWETWIDADPIYLDLDWWLTVKIDSIEGSRAESRWTDSDEFCDFPFASIRSVRRVTRYNQVKNDESLLALDEAERSSLDHEELYSMVERLCERIVPLILHD